MVRRRLRSLALTAASAAPAAWQCSPLSARLVARQRFCPVRWRPSSIDLPISRVAGAMQPRSEKEDKASAKYERCSVRQLVLGPFSGGYKQSFIRPALFNDAD
jgi:hypothetical protein